MFFIFLSVVPFGVYTAKYWKDDKTWISTHKTIMTLSITESFAFAFAALATGSLTFDFVHRFVKF